MPAPDLDSLSELRGEIEVFLKTLVHPIVVENEEELFDLTAARWKLSVEFGKLLFEAWNDARSIGRRVEEIAYRDRGRLGIFVRKPGGRETTTLEFRDLEPARTTGGGENKAARSRPRSRRELLSLLEREFPGWKFERVSNRSDREHSFSTWYTRGLARQGRSAWAFLGLSEDEPPAAADAVLAHGLIWLDWLRCRSDRVAVTGLKLFLPPGAVELAAHRSTCLNRRALQLEIFEWNARQGRAAPVDLRDFGNVATHLAHRRRAEALIERHRKMLDELLGAAADQVDVAADSLANFLSLRVRGLEIARVEGQVAPRIYFGLEGNVRPLEKDSREEFQHFLKQVLEIRSAASRDTSHEYYRLQSERWLESLLLCDITRIDPALAPDCVYPQVPAFAGGDRGVIDILSVARDGRLAVIELKLTEDINLPMQGLDYWLRVKWLAERGEFRERGYFAGRETSPRPPRLYLACPAFRFHSTTDLMFRYLDPSIEIVQIGLNEQWREHVQVLFRRERPSS
jgi:hypothetical protein